MEAVRALIKAGISMSHPIEVISFQDEEGVRFGAGYTGSRGMFGKISEDTLNLKDDLGRHIKKHMSRQVLILLNFIKLSGLRKRSRRI